MPKLSNESFDQKYSKDTKTASATASPEEPTTETTTGKKHKLFTIPKNPSITPAEYIYQSMIPPSKSTYDTVEVSRDNRERCNTGGSSRSLGGVSFMSGGAGAVMSMDLFLSSGDLQLDDDTKMRFQSSDLVRDLLETEGDNTRLPDTAATAAAALNAEHTEPLADEKPSSFPEQEVEEEVYEFQPILGLSAKLERMSTGESVAPLNENFRINSRDWVKDFKAETPVDGVGPMHQSLFMEQAASNSSLMNDVSVRYSGDWVGDFKTESPAGGVGPANPSVFMEHAASNSSLMKDASNSSVMKDVPRNSATPSPIPINAPQYKDIEVPIQSSGHSHQPMPPLSGPKIVHNLPTTTSPVVSVRKTSSPSSSTTSKGKKKPRRVIDTSQPIDPLDDDVLFGRGGYTNTHRGNLDFRKKAMELRPWYETVSKEEKYNISNILIESVTGQGHRFLEKGKEDGLWYEVVGNGARRKASQALRERIKGKRKSSVSGRVKLSSSVTSAGSGLGGSVNVDDIGDLMPADVVGV